MHLSRQSAVEAVLLSVPLSHASGNGVFSIQLDSSTSTLSISSSFWWNLILKTLTGLGQGVVSALAFTHLWGMGLGEPTFRRT
jgi:hypothetical protein